MVNLYLFVILLFFIYDFILSAKVSTDDIIELPIFNNHLYLLIKRCSSYKSLTSNSRLKILPDQGQSKYAIRSRAVINMLLLFFIVCMKIIYWVLSVIMVLTICTEGTLNPWSHNQSCVSLKSRILLIYMIYTTTS